MTTREQRALALFKWGEVHETFESILSFLAFLEEEHGVELNFEYAKLGTPLEVKKLVAKFLDVDFQVLDEARRELL